MSDKSENQEPQNSREISEAWNPDYPVELRLEAAAQLLMGSFPQAIVLGLPAPGKNVGSGIYGGWRGDPSSLGGWASWLQAQLVAEMDAAIAGPSAVDEVLSSQDQNSENTNPDKSRARFPRPKYEFGGQDPFAAIVPCLSNHNKTIHPTRTTQ